MYLVKQVQTLSYCDELVYSTIVFTSCLVWYIVQNNGITLLIILRRNNFYLSRYNKYHVINIHNPQIRLATVTKAVS